MTERTAALRISIGATGTFVLFLLLTGCAPREMAERTRGAGAAQDDVGRAESVEGARDTVTGARMSYDIENEMPETSPQRPAQLIEKLEPVGPDSISVQDVAVVEAPKQRYDVGYRIQVFASGDRSAAERVRERIVAETAMSAYIEYEEGLYKVRAGDFAERADAAQAGLKLAGAYPGSWIVRTTIRR
jgi:cell division protein FtsN